MNIHPTRAGLLTCASCLAFLSIDAAPAAAQAEEAEPERIVVTAQRREQELSDVSISVTAVGAERLETAQIRNIEDLQQIVPSIQMGNDFNMAKLFIRGVGANTSTTGSETGVAMHVDGAFVARAEAQLTSLFDLERVEVLRGPQGTLYGRNAVGGSINLITAKPTDEPAGYVRGTIGNYEAYTIEGAAGGPISDNLLARIAFRSEQRGGFGENPVTGNDVDDLSREMFRGHLLMRPAESWEVLLTGEVYTQDDASRALKFRRESYPGLVRLVAGGVGGYASDPRDVAGELDPVTETETWAVTARTDWEVSDTLSFTNITNYREFDAFIGQDLDISAVANSLATTGFNTTYQRRDIRSRQISTEFQGTLETDWLSGVLGLFYFNENQNPTDTVGLGLAVGQDHILDTLANPAGGAFPPIGPTGLEVDGVFVDDSQPYPLDTALGYCQTADFVLIDPATPPAPKRVCINSALKNEAWAAFGQFTFELGRLTPALEDFAVKLGGRYSSETVSASNPNVIIARNGLGPIITGTPEGTFNQSEFDDFTPEVGVEWTPNDDLLLYYTYAEGFKAGAGENAAPSGGSPIPFVSTIVEPEEVESHEIGVRATLVNGAVDLAAAAFTYELTGQQINKTIAGGPAGFSTIFENAAQTSADGVEIEFAAEPTDVFRLSGAVSWLDSKYDDFLTADPLDPANVSTPGPCPSPPDPIATCFNPLNPQVQLAGNRTRNSPEWAANLHGELDLLRGNALGGGAIILMGDVTYKDDVYFTEFQRLLEGQDAYTIWDFNLRFEDAVGQLTADLWIKNATDEDVATSTFALATARTIGVTYLPPQTYGLSLGYRF